MGKHGDRRDGKRARPKTAVKKVKKRTKEKDVVLTKYGPIPVVRQTRTLHDGSAWEYMGIDLDFQPPLPSGAVRGNPRAQSYCCSMPCFFYVDTDRFCQACKRNFRFSAEEQKFWYETLAFFSWSVPNRCLPCRKELRAEKSIRGEYVAAIEGAKEAPVDASARLREAEARVRYFEQCEQGNPELAIAAARAARKHDRGEQRVRSADLWEGWAQAQQGRGDLARELIESFVEHCTGKQNRALRKEARDLLKRIAELAGPKASGDGKGPK